MIGANAVTQIPTTRGEGLAGFGLGPDGALAVNVFAYIILGMVLVGLAMPVVTIQIIGSPRSCQTRCSA